MKPEIWKQANPHDQLTAIRGSLEGNLLSFESNHITKSVFISRMFEHLDQIEKLEPYLKGNLDWNSSSEEEIYVNVIPFHGHTDEEVVALLRKVGAKEVEILVENHIFAKIIESKLGSIRAFAQVYRPMNQSS